MRAIDADALRDRLQNLGYDDWNQGTTTTWAEAFKECADMVDEMPTIELEIVRCKDCEWFHDIGCAIQIVDDSDKPSENDYCSFAERKTDE